MNAEQAKFLASYFAETIDSERKTTAKVLAAVPDPATSGAYKPDPKSRSGWELALHLATGDVWFLSSILKGSFEFDPKAEKAMHQQFTASAQVVEFYDREMSALVDQLRAQSGEELAKDVDFFGLMQKPKSALLGGAVSHGVHHRGQLAAYLRAMGGKVPSIYGGSADESFN